MFIPVLFLFFFQASGNIGGTVAQNSFADQWSTLWSTKKSGKNKSRSSFLPSSDLAPHDRRIWIITTACLPWMTGTSINPLLRAAYLAKERPMGMITLMVPWVDRDDQDLLYPPGIRFDHPDEQKEYVKNWLRHDAHLPVSAERLNIVFYAGRFHDEYHSIFPMGDITELIPDESADICVLEEPEHLNWYRAPFTSKAWKDKFNHVVGVMHTNYLMYSRQHPGGMIKEPMLYVINQAMCRSYCHKIIKLSGALQEFAPEIEEISNVHGVRQKFLSAGDDAAMKGFSKGAYFVGKMAWQKGLDELFRLMKHTEKRMGRCFPIDVYGAGPHLNEIKQTAKSEKLNVSFHGPKDHSLLTEYKVFVNPSLSEVLCTTVAEALAMGKWVVCPEHPSNAFFQQFPNCLTYRTKEEFAANMFWALNNEPAPLSPELRRELTWEAATERFMVASRLSAEMHYNNKALGALEKLSRWTHTFIGSGSHGDAVRFLAGAKTVSNQIEFMGKHGTSDPKKVLEQQEKIPPEKMDEEGYASNNSQSGEIVGSGKGKVVMV